jgi:uncharacterized protein (TIGR02598 family)
MSAPFHFRQTCLAFSLIEIVLALGIVSFALVGIIGMLPAAMDAATNSQQETQAAFIARALYSEMTSMPGSSTFVATSTNFYDNVDAGDKIAINLATPNRYYLAYDTEGMPLKATDTGTFASGDRNAGFLTSITISTNNVPIGISRVDVRVDAPGGAAETSRRSYYFSTLLKQKENP